MAQRAGSLRRPGAPNGECNLFTVYGTIPVVEDLTVYQPLTLPSEYNASAPGRPLYYSIDQIADVTIEHLEFGTGTVIGMWTLPQQ